jgi:hypothetical protein
MREFLLPVLLFSLIAVVACPTDELTNQQKQILADLKGITDSYLITEVMKPNFGGKVFCAYHVLEVEEKGDVVDEYVLALCQEYSVRDEKLSKGTGVAIPVAIRTARQEKAYRFVSGRIPRDAGYANEVKRIFPAKTHEEIFYRRNDDLLAEVEKEAKNYYGIK